MISPLSGVDFMTAKPDKDYSPKIARNQRHFRRAPAGLALHSVLRNLQDLIRQNRTQDAGGVAT